MTRTRALAGAAAVLLLANGAAARADSGGHDPAAPTEMGTQMQHGTHQMSDGTQMQGGAGMPDGTHQMQDGTQMQGGAGMQHGTHQAGTTNASGRPRALTLGGFALANVIVLLAAAVVRHRDRRRPGRGPAVAGGAR